MLLVGGGDVQAGRGHTPDDGKGHVEQRHPEDHHGDEHGGEEEERLAAVGRLGTTTHRDRGGRHEQAQEQRPAVAHEDPGGVDVVGQEADAYPDHDDGQNRSRISVEEEPLVSEADRVQEEGGRGDGRDAGRQAVQPVGQVQGVGQEHHPHHCEQGRQVGREQHDVQERDAQHDQRYAGQRQHAAGQHHPGDLGRCGHGSHVVYDPDCTDDDRSRHHADHLRRSGEHLPEVSEHPGDQDPGQQAQEHRSSAQRGGGCRVDVALVGGDQQAGADGEAPDQRGGRGGHQGGHGADD